MYICSTHSLKLKGGRVALRGEPVPEAMEWPENVRRANVNMGFITLAPEAAKPSAHPVDASISYAAKAPRPTPKPAAKPAPAAEPEDELAKELGITPAKETPKKKRR